MPSERVSLPQFKAIVIKARVQWEVCKELGAPFQGDILIPFWHQCIVRMYQGTVPWGIRTIDRVYHGAEALAHHAFLGLVEEYDWSRAWWDNRPAHFHELVSLYLLEDRFLHVE